MTISQSLKYKNKLVASINKLWSQVQSHNSVYVGVTRPYDIEKIYIYDFTTTGMLKLEGNDFYGDIPVGICQNIQYLSGNCAETRRPTPSPASGPQSVGRDWAVQSVPSPSPTYEYWWSCNCCTTCYPGEEQLVQTRLGYNIIKICINIMSTFRFMALSVLRVFALSIHAKMLGMTIISRSRSGPHQPCNIKSNHSVYSVAFSPPHELSNSYTASDLSQYRHISQTSERGFTSCTPWLMSESPM